MHHPQHDILSCRRSLMSMPQGGRQWRAAMPVRGSKGSQLSWRRLKRNCKRGASTLRSLKVSSASLRPPVLHPQHSTDYVVNIFLALAETSLLKSKYETLEKAFKRSEDQKKHLKTKVRVSLSITRTPASIVCHENTRHSLKTRTRLCWYLKKSGKLAGTLLGYG